MPAENTAVVAVGVILDGKFRVCREIGRGGMAAVYEAENVDIGKRVAVKVLSEELATSRVVTERFMREARAAAKIRSPYICDVYDVGTYNGRPFLVMELLEGESLYDRLARDRRVPAKEVVQIASETAQGLQQAHDAGIVHRDLKPENIFLTVSGGGERTTKIVDFGLAKFYEPNLEGGDSARLTKEGALFGTPAYMSPEQASAQGPIGHRSDLWALGCIVYEMLVGRTVWNVDQGVAMILAQIAGGPIPTPSKVYPALPQSFDHWFARAVNRDPEKRFATATELAEQLRKALSKPKLQAPPAPTPHESHSVDALVAAPPAMSAPALSAPIALRPPVAPVGTPSAQPIAPSSLPSGVRRVGRRTLPVVFTLIALGVIGLVTWVGLRHPEKLLRRFGHSTVPDPVETEADALLIADGQQQLVDGDLEGAMQIFDRAFESSKHKVARSLRSHGQAIQEAGEEDAPCKVRGLGHPRPFDSSERSSQPTILHSGDRLQAAWAAPDGTGRRPIFLTQLDLALRRIARATDVTPQAHSTRDPQLFPTKQGFGLLYTDAEGSSSSIFLRTFGADAKATGDAVLLSPSSREYAYDPTFAAGPEEQRWVVFTQATHKQVHDLFLTKLDTELRPIASPVQLTAYSVPNRSRQAASVASAAMGGGLLHVAYRLQRGSNHEVMLLRASPQSSALLANGVERASDEPVRPGDEEGDRFVGQVMTLAQETGPDAQPRILCTQASCFSAWSTKDVGAHAVLTDAVSGEIRWRRHLGAESSRPTFARHGEDVVMVWYRDNRVVVASVDAEGVGPASVVARVAGLQPFPSVVAGAERGQWYIAWRGFEAAVMEPFVVRVECE